MLGIVIGVAAVIATVAVGSGATQRVQQQIASIGSNLVIIIPGSLTASGLRMGTGNAVTLSETDAKELTGQCPDIATAAPAVRGGAQVVYGDNNWGTIILNTTPSYLTIRDLSVARGISFSERDVDSANKVALLGQTVVDNLFGSADPVGQTIRIKHVPFAGCGSSGTQGPIPNRAGPGRYYPDANFHGEKKSNRHEISQRRRRGHHSDAGQQCKPDRSCTK